ncbi:MAG: hypothetical protein EXQ87_08075 [Alphaproteobacteria bacterium]|nr:hypothetical protein [Alphaproteobacteria bacterium]
MAVAWGAAADRLTDRIGEVCAQAVAAEFRNRGRADHFEDHGSAFGARIYVNNRDFFNCHVSKDFRHYTLFDMTGKQVARGNSAGGDDRGYPTAGPDGDDLLESLLGIRRDDGRHDDRRQDGRFAERGFSRGEIVVYEHRGFRGSSRQFHGEMRNLGQTGLNDAISSVHILSGVWEFCSDADYRGRCILLDRDENDLADHGLGDRVSSFRPVRR